MSSTNDTDTFHRMCTEIEFRKEFLLNIQRKTIISLEENICFECKNKKIESTEQNCLKNNDNYGCCYCSHCYSPNNLQGKDKYCFVINNLSVQIVKIHIRLKEQIINTPWKTMTVTR
eukprot:Pgem_evm2s2124